MIPITPAQFSILAARIDAALDGSDAVATSISTSFPPDRAGSVSFCVRLPDPVPPMPHPSLVIALPGLRSRLIAAGVSVIQSTYPKYDLARLAAHASDRPPARIHPSASIGDRVTLGPDVAIGPGSVLDGDIVVGAGTSIGANVVLTNRVTIGENVRIFNGGVIGEAPYSFGFGARHRTVRFPADGGVVIGSGVEIGNNVVIARGVGANTVLEEDSRVNDLAHIGNSVRLGARSLVMANCDISARVVIGEECWIGQSSVVLQNLHIGDCTQVGAGAVVTHDVPDGVVVYGMPARIRRARTRGGS